MELTHSTSRSTLDVAPLAVAGCRFCISKGAAQSPAPLRLTRVFELEAPAFMGRCSSCTPQRSGGTPARTGYGRYLPLTRAGPDDHAWTHPSPSGHYQPNSSGHAAKAKEASRNGSLAQGDKTYMRLLDRNASIAEAAPTVAELHRQARRAANVHRCRAAPLTPRPGSGR